MCSKRDTIIFLAGAEAFHTLAQIMFMFSGMLPITIFSIEVTPAYLTGCIIFNGLVTIALLWWACRLSADKGGFWSRIFKK